MMIVWRTWRSKKRTVHRIIITCSAADISHQNHFKISSGNVLGFTNGRPLGLGSNRTIYERISILWTKDTSPPTPKRQTWTWPPHILRPEKAPLYSVTKSITTCKLVFTNDLTDAVQHPTQMSCNHRDFVFFMVCFMNEFSGKARSTAIRTYYIGGTRNHDLETGTGIESDKVSVSLSQMW